MTTFRTTYPNSKTSDTESSDCETVEQFCNSHFGTTWDVTQLMGAKVEIIDATEVERWNEHIRQNELIEQARAAEPEVLSGAEVVAEVTGEQVAETVTAKAVKAVKAAVKKVTPAKKAKK